MYVYVCATDVYVYVCATYMLTYMPCGCVRTCMCYAYVVRLCVDTCYICHTHVYSRILHRCTYAHMSMYAHSHVCTRENRPLKRVRAEWGVFLRAPRTCIYVYVPRDTDLCERIFLSPLFCWPSWPTAIRRLSLPSSRHRCLGCCAAVAPRPRHLLGKAALRMVGGGRRARRVRKAEGCI